MSDPGTYRILVVDDEASVLITYRLILEQEGYKVYKAECCDAAFDVLANHRIQLIITDLMLPGMTGLEFIHKVRRVANYDLIPVVAMSAFDQKYLAAAAQAGAIRILHKPEDLDLLVPTVNQLLQEHASHSNHSASASS